MALYRDEKGTYYLCSFRSALRVDKEQVGGLFTFKQAKWQSFDLASTMVTALGAVTTLAFVVLGLLNHETVDGSRQLLLIAVMGFAPFALLLGAIGYCTSAPKFVSLEDTKLEIAALPTSTKFHAALTLSGLSIFALFLYLYIFLDADDTDDLTVFGLMAVFWLLYTAARGVGLERMMRYVNKR